MDAFLLARLARELDLRYSGAWVQGVWQDVRGRLVLRLRGTEGTVHLALSALPEAQGLGLLDRRPPCPPAPPALAAYLRAHLKGGKLSAAQALPFERVVRVTLTRPGDRAPFQVHLEAIGSRGNIVATDADGVIRAAVRFDRSCGDGAGRIMPGRPYRPPPPGERREMPGALVPATLEALAASGEPLHRRIQGLSPELAREVLQRAAASGLWAAWRAVIDAYGANGPVYEYAEGWLSAIPLHHLGLPVGEHRQALRRCGERLDADLRAAAEDRSRAAEERRLQNFSTRAQRKLRRIREDLARLPDGAALRAEADALAAVLWRVRAGDRAIEVVDPAVPTRRRCLTLDPALSPGENLDAMYRRAKKAARARAIIEGRLSEAEAEVAAGAPPGTAHPIPPPGQGRAVGAHAYRRFVSSDGWPIWVGRNRVENDRLLREARSWDLWLHAREASGAHVLIRKPGREAKVPRRTLEEAAGLAVRFSGRSAEGASDVMVLEAGRVRKPKGGAPGRVLVAGEATIRAAPGAGNPRPA